MKNKSLLIIVSSVALLLLIPLIAMQFTDEVNWSLFDFLIAAVLISGCGLTIAFILKKVKKTNYRIILITILLLILLLIWVELGIGIFGTPFAGN